MKTAYCRSGQGRPLTLVHGVGATLGSWDGVVEQLGEGFEAIRYDLRGHGVSSKPPGPYSLGQFVDDLARLLDYLQIDRTALAGFSFGGLIGPAFALAYPERVARLAIISAVSGRTPGEQAAANARADALAEGGAGRTIEAALERWFTPEFRAANPDVIAARTRQAMDNDPAGYAAAYRVFCESDLAGQLEAITCPTLVMTGEQDPGSNVRMARYMHRCIAGSQLAILPGLRHSILVEAPELIAKHLRDFLS